MKKRYLLWAGLLLCWSFPTHAQPGNGCGVPAPPGAVLQQNDARADQFLHRTSRQSTALIVPVVFHVFHSLYTTDQPGSGTNVSHQSLVDMLNFTNQLLRKQNADTSQIPSAFLPFAADCGVELCLAQQDPSGNAMYETGVERIVASTSGVPGNVFTQPATFSQGYASPFAWDPTRYLNVYIMPVYFYGGAYSGWGMFPDSSGLAGLQVANGNGPGDGIYITYTQVSAQTRLMAHELGHFFGLRHIWGDASCGDDYCNDTPTQSTSNTGCPTFPHVTCTNGPNGDMFCNYMDYTSSACQHMFSYDQAARIQTVLALSPRRRELPLSTVCSPGPPTLPVADFLASPSVACPMEPIHYIDASGYQPVAWSWSFPGGSPSTSTLQNPVVTYAAPGTYSATLIVTNATGNDTLTMSAAVTINSFGNFPVADNFENQQVPPPDWQLMNVTTNMPPPSWQLANASAFGTGSYSISSFIWNMHPVRSYLLDFTNYASPTFSFDYASAANANMQPDAADWCDVMVSTDCGVSFTTVLHLDSAAFNTAPAAVNFVPSASQWRHAVANLWAYAGVSGVYVQLYGFASPNYFYLDNLNLYDQGALAVHDVSSPGNGFNLLPNPSGGDTKIRFAAPVNHCRVTVRDIAGRVCGDFYASGEEVSLRQQLGRNLEPGLYLVSAGEGADMVTQRLVITR